MSSALVGPPRFAGPVKLEEVEARPKVVASIVGMWAAGMNSNEICKALVVPESVIVRVLHAERERQRSLG